MIITSISAGHTRLALRLYFLIITMIVAGLTSSALTARAKLRVLRKQTVPVTYTLGWLQGPDLIRSMWGLRALPGGKLGYVIMLLLFVLSKLDDLVTTTLVRQVQVKSRCPYNEGMVFNTSASLFSSPPFNGRPFIVANNAQYSSMNNTCPYGIFTKINQDPKFCAAPEDLIGTWNCNSVATNTFTFGTGINEIIGSLGEKTQLFSNSSFAYSGYAGDCSGAETVSAFDHFVVWSSSAISSEAQTVWNVSAAIQTNFDPCADITMESITCYMDAPEAENIAKTMDSSASLANWRMSFQGLMYYGSLTPAIQYPEQQLAILLNTMMMVQGGNNFLLSTLPPDADQTYGCLAFATEVPIAVEALVLVTAFFVILAAIALVLYKTRIVMQPKHKREAMHNFPSGVVSWAALAATEHDTGTNPRHGEPNVIGRKVQESELKNWVVGLSTAMDGTTTLRVQSASAEHGLPVLGTEYPMHYISVAQNKH